MAHRSVLDKRSRQFALTMKDEHSGWLTKQGGRHKSWKRRWFSIRGMQMLYYKDPLEPKPLGAITLAYPMDLDGHLSRTVSLVSADESPQGKAHCFEIKGRQAGQRTYYCVAETSAEADGWIDAIRRVIHAREGGGMFGSDVADQVAREGGGGEDVPIIVSKCVGRILQSVDEVGIFRLPGRTIRVRELKEAFGTGQDPVIQEEREVHAVASLLKLYLRDLPEPLMTFDRFRDFSNAAEVYKTDPGRGTPLIQDLVATLPRANAVLLRYLCIFLSDVVAHSDVNKMTLGNMATVFAPNFLMPQTQSPEVLMQSTALTHALVSALIRDHETLFLKMPDWAPDTPPSDGGETEPSIQQVLAEYDSEEEEAGGTPGSRSPVTGRKSMSSNQPASPSRLRSSSTATDDPAALRQQLQEEKLTTARLQEKVRQLAAANNVLQSDAEREQVARISAEQRLNLLVSQMRALGVVMPNVPGITQDDAMTGPDDCPVAPLRASAPKNHRESVDGDTFNLMDMAMANGAGGGAGGETATPPRVPNPFPLPP